MFPRSNNLALRFAPLLIALVAAGFTMVKGCQEGPFGRRQIVGMGVQEETALGVQAFQQVVSQSNVVHHTPLAQTVKNITIRLAQATTHERFLQLVKQKPQKFGWDVRLVSSQERNAFCLPGGKMVVYTGIIPVAQNEAGLATVMGHEISHALAHHGAERMGHQKLAQIGIMAAGTSLGDMSPASRMQIMQVLNAGAQYGIMKYSREHESEADHMGLLLMAAAGYDPRESLRFWQRMKQAAGPGKGAPEFVSTHPSHETRINDLARWLPEALPLYESSNKVPDRTLSVK